MHLGALLLLFTLLAPSLRAEAQPAKKVPRVGLLMPVSYAAAAPNVEAFRQGLGEHGWVEGRNIGIEVRYSDGQAERLAELATELVRLKVDVIVTWGTPAARAAKNVTTSIPIVMAAATDAVATGLIASLARPGGNVTGVTSGGAELSGKNLQLLNELVPRVARVAILWNPENPSQAPMFEQTAAVARALGLQLRSLELRAPDEFERAFKAMMHQRVGALVVFQELVFFAHRKRIVDLAAQHRLPAIYERREYVDAGGLMSYGVNFRHNFRHAASYVDKILRGAKPADLAVEQPTRFELVINVKTARALGLTISQSLLLRADQLIND